MNPLRIAIIGCGSIANTHAKTLSSYSNLVFHSRDPAKAEAYQQRYCPSEKVHSFDAIIRDHSIKAVIICTPPDQHIEYVVPLLHAKKKVLVEKPLCTSPEELNTLERQVSSDRLESHFMVAENYYYKPSLRKLKLILDSGRIGDLQRVLLRKEFMQSSVGWKSQLGALLEGGIHFVAFLNDLVGAEVDEPFNQIEAVFDGNQNQGPERSSQLKIIYQNQVKGELYYSWETPAKLKGIFQHSLLEGSRGKVVFESNGLYHWVRKQGKTTEIKLGCRDLSGHYAMIQDFLQFVKDNKKPCSSFKKAKRDLRCIFKAYGARDSERSLL